MKVHSKRNNGWGSSLNWAACQALYHAYGDGHYGTVATHRRHLQVLVNWLKDHDIRDYMDVTIEDLKRFGKDIARKYSNNYARNLISSVNVTLKSIRGDNRVRLNPSEVLPPRRSARTTAPAGYHYNPVRMVVSQLNDQGEEHAALIIQMAWHFGVRLREACLFDFSVAVRQAKRYGKIDIRCGTKGGRGRHVARWVPVCEKGLAVLKQGKKLTGGNNLIPADMSLVQFMRRVRKAWSRVRGDLGRIHDLRAAYVCRRYIEITGKEAPVCNGGKMSATKDQDYEARCVITQEIGHGHPSRVAAYGGSSK